MEELNLALCTLHTRWWTKLCDYPSSCCLKCQSAAWLHIFIISCNRSTGKRAVLTHWKDGCCHLVLKNMTCSRQLFNFLLCIQTDWILSRCQSPILWIAWLSCACKHTEYFMKHIHLSPSSHPLLVFTLWNKKIASSFLRDFKVTLLFKILRSMVKQASIALAVHHNVCSRFLFIQVMVNLRTVSSLEVKKRSGQVAKHV